MTLTRDVLSIRDASLREYAMWQWDHLPFLYQGGTACDARDFRRLLDLGSFGSLDHNRLPLILKIKELIDGRLTAGGSPQYAKTVVVKLKSFYTWADNNSRDLTIDGVATSFVGWTEHLRSRARMKAIKRRTAYDYAAVIASVLNEVLDVNVNLLRRAKLHKGRILEQRWADHESTDIEKIFQFGNALGDICQALTTEAIRGCLPILIPFRSGLIFKHWSGLQVPERLKALNGHDEKNKPKVLEKRRAWELDTSLRTRHSVVNLRIEAEALTFVAQTGMNWAQVWGLKIGRFSYESHTGGYLVRRYKARRQGEVEFEIHREYRHIFESYLAWRGSFFASDDESLLFPLIGRVAIDQRRSLNGPCEGFRLIRGVCKLIDIQFINPSLLRKARVNWLARKSGDIGQTAEMAQHTKEVLIRNYLRPDSNIAAVEISRFYQQSIQSVASAGPGICAQRNAELLPQMPRGVPQPDCISPAGCLFCAQQRDIDSFDHVWNLISYRHLKILELSLYRSSHNLESVHPAKLVIDRITEKIASISEYDGDRSQWIEEALDKVREGDIHPMWQSFIELAEAIL